MQNSLTTPASLTTFPLTDSTVNKTDLDEKKERLAKLKRSMRPVEILIAVTGLFGGYAVIFLNLPSIVDCGLAMALGALCFINANKTETVYKLRKAIASSEAK